MVTYSKVNLLASWNGHRFSLRPIKAFILAALVIASASCEAPAVASKTGSVEGYLGDLKVTPVPNLALAFPGGLLEYYHYLREAGIGIVRLGVQWRWIEPTPGTFVWKGLDERIRKLQELGINVLITLSSDAPWAVNAESSRHVMNATPKLLETWRRFCEAVAERYDGDGKNDMEGLRFPIYYYQIANEWGTPNNKAGGWAGTTEELVSYIGAAYEAIKGVHPDALVVLGGLATGHLDVLVNAEGLGDYPVKVPTKKAWREITSTFIHSKEVRENIEGRVYPVLHKAKYDLASVHLYGLPERNHDRIEFVRRQIGTHPMVSSECGGPSLAYQKIYRPKDHFFAVIEHNLSALSDGLLFCMWYHLGDHPGKHVNYETQKTGLFDENRKPKPGFYAYKLLAALLDNADGVETANGGSSYLIHYRDGSQSIIAWARKDGASELTVPFSDKAYDVLEVTDPVIGSFSLHRGEKSRILKLSQNIIVAGPLLAKRFGVSN